ncbi:hypothetical protein C8R45DRAFT_929323 [Mycena sanguinolenta]|nr:hypothetical protein C8R45DRAFT_929323 [Mycena sanguinolenta]
MPPSGRTFVYARGDYVTTNNPDSSLQNDANWTNDCAHWTNLISGSCYTLDAGHQNSISSFGPDGTTTCSLYTDYHCTDGCILLTGGGSSDLSLDPGYTGENCNDRINSFFCYQAGE